MLDCGIFGRKTKGIPAHRMKHVITVHYFKTRHYIADGIIADMPHMQISRRIRKHFQAIIFRFRRILAHPINSFFFPIILPFFLNGRKIILLLHSCFLFSPDYFNHSLFREQFFRRQKLFFSHFNSCLCHLFYNRFNRFLADDMLYTAGIFFRDFLRYS